MTRRFRTICSLLFLCFTLSQGQVLAEITESEATKIAEREIAKSSVACVLLPESTRHEDFGWVFYYTTRKYTQTHNPNDTVPGMGPIAVERDGTLTHITTSVEPDSAIKAFGDALKSKDSKTLARMRRGVSDTDSGHMTAKDREEK